MAIGYSRNLYSELFNSDKYLDLEPCQRLLFIYLFGNKQTLRCGILRISYHELVRQSGLSRADVVTALGIYASPEYQWIEIDEPYIWLVDFMEDQCNSANWFVGARREAAQLIGKTKLADRCLSAYPADWYAVRTPSERRQDGNRTQETGTETALDSALEPEQKRALLELFNKLTEVVNTSRVDAGLGPIEQQRDAAMLTLLQIHTQHLLTGRDLVALARWMFAPENKDRKFNLTRMSLLHNWRNAWQDGIAVIVKWEEYLLWSKQQQAA